jgi:hypothetical protein
MQEKRKELQTSLSLATLEEIFTTPGGFDVIHSHGNPLKQEKHKRQRVMTWARRVVKPS